MGFYNLTGTMNWSGKLCNNGVAYAGRSTAWCGGMQMQDSPSYKAKWRTDVCHPDWSDMRGITSTA